MGKLAEWITADDMDIPSSVMDHAKLAILNWLAVTWYGGKTPEGTIFSSEAWSPNARQHVGSSAVVGSGQLTLPPFAAYVNAANSHVLDFDDTHLSTVIHPSSPVLAALFAATAEGVYSGETFLRSFVLGTELFLRIGLALNPSHYKRGWHITSSLGAIGGSFALAKLKELPYQKSLNAASLAGIGSHGFQAAFGTMGKAHQVGLAAQQSVQATSLAESGAWGPHDIFEHPHGMSILTEEIDVSNFDSLGSTWEFQKISFKPYPCGIVTHPIIDLGIRLHNLYSAEQVSNITCYVHPLVNQLTGIVRPRNGLERKFSAKFLLSLALSEGSVMPQHFVDDLPVSNIMHMIPQINFIEDPSMPRNSVSAEVQLLSGEKVEVTIQHARGSIERPLTTLELRTKFDSLTVEWPQSQRDACWLGVEEFESLDNVGSWFGMFSNGAT